MMRQIKATLAQIDSFIREISPILIKRGDIMERDFNMVICKISLLRDILEEDIEEQRIELISQEIVVVHKFLEECKEKINVQINRQMNGLRMDLFVYSEENNKIDEEVDFYYCGNCQYSHEGSCRTSMYF